MSGKAPKKEQKTKVFGKKKENRVILPKARRVYPTEDVKQRLPSSRPARKPTALRSSIKPGTVLIVLAGKYRGKRVVFLKQLPSGLLLVTGPFKINGVPLRRMNQAYVIGTSTVVDLASLKVDDKYNDKYFTKPQEKTKKAEPEQIFADDKKQKKQIDASKVTDQKAFDKPILDAVKKVPNLKEYLGSKFSLRKGQNPHELRF
eukprot:TRINITY_DN13_c0_g1_i1.p1 TRINITY_DN13_c0_g1~~TRINITY_DN13_c0_g1_i1.p1  ORF type:complete len:203 (-),score=65.27 TRINITY_DN13_c0_g1_i1:50-658(-)